MKANAERRKKTVLFEARSAPTLAILEEISPEISKCLDRAFLIEKLIMTAKNELPSLMDGMEDARRRDGLMTRTREISVTGVDAQGRERRNWINDRKSYATVPTYAPFKSGLSRRLRAIQTGLRAVKTILEKDDVTLQQQASAFDRLRRLSRDFRDIRVDAEKCKEFFSPEFWEKVAQWGRSDPYRQGNFRVSKRIVRHSDDDNVYGVLPLPDPSKFNLACFEKVQLGWPQL